ncbi:MAG: oligosaccharide flippase family protein, partial [Muribaculaceae bacterium]|nr:oligosaccharide flippase family protein [Muribaculaceae bacterium]
KLFSFGGKLLVSSLINNIYSNISTFIIGKAYQATDLGFYTRANQFSQLPTQTISNIVVKVNYPILAQVQDDNAKLINAYKTLLRTPVFILYPILFGLAILARPFIEVLLGDKWLQSASLIPILCCGNLWNPLTDINLNLLYVKGKTDLVLKLELIKKPIAFLMLIASVPFGLKGMCVAISLYNFIAFCFNCHYTGKILDYGFFKQVKSLLPILGYCIIMGAVVFGISSIFENPLFQLSAGILSGVLSYLTIALLAHDQSLIHLRQILLKK